MKLLLFLLIFNGYLIASQPPQKPTIPPLDLKNLSKAKRRYQYTIEELKIIRDKMIKNDKKDEKKK